MADLVTSGPGHPNDPTLGQTAKYWAAVHKDLQKQEADIDKQGRGANRAWIKANSGARPFKMPGS